MRESIALRGITWDHSRAFPPLVATAQRYEETHPGVRIRWEKRTLDEFGHKPIDQLAEEFDLIVIDHPWAGFAFAKKLVLDLKPLLPAEVLADLSRESIGQTFASYFFEGKLLALPIDAAAPAPSWRTDLLALHEIEPPSTWAEAIALSRRKLAVIPAFNADLFLHFMMLVKALGADVCNDADTFAPRDVARAAIDLLRELTEPMPREIFEWNPIRVAELMTISDRFAWNAFAYTYNNYSRPGFAPKPLRFGNLISLKAGGPRLRSVLGGTGLAISCKCRSVESALDYALFTASSHIQRTICLHAGGQPSHRIVWADAQSDALCVGFFSGTRQTQEEAFVRPRYNGYVPLQTLGGNLLQEHLRDGRNLDTVLEELDALYRKSRNAL